MGIRVALVSWHSAHAPVAASSHKILGPRLLLPLRGALISSVNRGLVISRLCQRLADMEVVLGFKGRGYILAQRLAGWLLSRAPFLSGRLKRPACRRAAARQS